LIKNMENKLTDENFDKEINSHPDKFILVDFFATWCEPCSIIAPVLDKIVKEFEDKVILMKANLDENQFQAQKFGVDRIPAVILFKDKKPINGFVGLVPEESIKEWLKNIINK